MNLLERATSIGVQGFLHCSELEMLADLACGRDVLEVGSFKGLSAWGMAPVATSLLCVDTFKANSAGQQQMEEMTTYADFERATTQRFRNVSVMIATSEKAIGYFSSGDTFDMIFLDAMHTYEDVKADIERWWPKLRPRGIFAFHDYGHDHFPGVKQAVDERFGGPLKNVVVTLGWIVKGDEE